MDILPLSCRDPAPRALRIDEAALEDLLSPPLTPAVEEDSVRRLAAEFGRGGTVVLVNLVDFVASPLRLVEDNDGWTECLLLSNADEGVDGVLRFEPAAVVTTLICSLLEESLESSNGDDTGGSKMLSLSTAFSKSSA